MITLNKNKKWYLEVLEETALEKTLHVYKNKLYHLQKFENDIEKEIQDFDNEDLESFFLSLGKNVNSLSNTKSILFQYYDFLLENEKATGVNKLELVTQNLLKDWSNKRKDDYQFVSEVEANLIAMKFLYNHRDKAIFMLSWCGLSIDEIIELEYTDIDFERKIAKVNTKEFKLTDFTLCECRSSYENDEYLTNNGIAGKSDKSTKIFKSKPSTKVIKPNMTRRGNATDKCSKSAVDKAFRLLRDIPKEMIKRETGKYYCYPLNYLTNVSLVKSGLFDNLCKLEDLGNIDVKEELGKLYTYVPIIHGQYQNYRRNIYKRNIFSENEKEIALDQD